MMTKMRKKLSGNKGFTLVELIVVIAVLGILAGIAIPRLTGVQDKAKNSAIMTSAGTIRNAMEMVFAETGSYPNSLESWSNNLGLDTIDLPAVGENEGQVPVNTENISYSVDNDNGYFLITIQSSINTYEVYIGEKGVTDNNKGSSSNVTDYSS